MPRTPGLDGLGPIGGLDHGPDEYIQFSSIVPRTALLARLLQAICADAGTRRMHDRCRPMSASLLHA